MVHPPLARQCARGGCSRIPAGHRVCLAWPPAINPRLTPASRRLLVARARGRGFRVDSGRPRQVPARIAGEGELCGAVVGHGCAAPCGLLVRVRLLLFPARSVPGDVKIASPVTPTPSRPTLHIHVLRRTRPDMCDAARRRAKWRRHPICHTSNTGATSQRLTSRRTCWNICDATRSSAKRDTSNHRDSWGYAQRARAQPDAQRRRHRPATTNGMHAHHPHPRDPGQALGVAARCQP